MDGWLMPDSSLVPFDQNLVNECTLQVLGQDTIQFQFPPRITSESNNSEWESKDAQAIEPIKIHRGSGGRKISMEWEYIATDSTWGPKLVANTMRLLKTYFFEFELGEYPILELTYTQVVPIPTQFRLMNVDITYSPEIIGEGDAFHPIHTKVSISLEMVTRIGKPGGGEEKVKEKPLKDVEFAWY